LRALVTGANGALGPSLIIFLASKGWDVHALVRQPNLDILGRIPAKVFVGDITSPKSLREAFQGVDVVFHLAALLHILNPSEDSVQDYHLTNVIGTKNVISQAQQEGVRRVVFFSTIAVYGDHSSSVLTEETIPRPDSIYGRTKLEAEKVVLSARRNDGKPLGVVLRLSAVYGARIKGNYRRLLRSLDSGRFIPVGRGENRRTLVFDRDVAQAAFLTANHPAAPGSIYNVTDGHFHTVEEIITIMCDALGRTPPRLMLPIGPIRRIVGLSEDALRFFNRRAPITRASLDKFTEDIAVDGRRIQEHLGFSPQYDLAAGWNETVAEMRRSGDL